MTDKPIPHGTINGYNNFGCRCDLCRGAASVYNRKRNLSLCPGCGAETMNRFRPESLCRACRAKKNTIPLEERHGTELGYKKGCRCDLCRQGTAAARRRRRHANPEAERAYQREYRHRRRAVREG